MSDLVRSRVLGLYQAVAILMLASIGVLIAYSIRLGPLVGEGVESSFGLAVALMFLASALLVHLADRIYRVWPGGRRVIPSAPALVTERSIASFLKVVVLLAVAGSIAYVLATVLL